MADKVGAYGNKASEGSFRRKWDKETYTAKAAEQDASHAEHAKASQAAIQAGKKPPPRLKSELPKPTKALEARREDLEIEKNLGKTVLVDTVGRKGGAGFYCDLCRRTLKDSIAYLDHVNGRSHLAHLGQTTQVRRSTLQDVIARIESLRAASLNKVTSKNYDFATRLSEIRKIEEKRREDKKEARKRKRHENSGSGGAGAAAAAAAPASAAVGGANGNSTGQQKKSRLTTVEGTKGAFGNANEIKKAEEEADTLASMMGFGGFGGGVKKR